MSCPKEDDWNKLKRFARYMIDKERCIVNFKYQGLVKEGTVWTDHGILPVPAPATLRLLVDMPTCPGPMGVVTGELVTPTGAALLRALCLTMKYPGNDATILKATTQQLNGRPPNFTIRKIGIGAGTKDFEKHPNILRLILGNDIVMK